MIKPVFLVSLLFSILLVNTAHAQNKVVVIPLGGDDISSLPAFPQVWAQTDDDAGDKFETFVGNFNHEINSVLINAPSDGVIVISGKTFIRNDSASALVYLMEAKIDGSSAAAGNFDTSIYLLNGVFDETGTLNYTLTVPISAGEHTVSQELSLLPPIGASNTHKFFYNAEALTVMFFATGEVTAPECTENCNTGI